MTGRGLSERSGFRARAGTLTLLFLASLEDPQDLCEMLAQLDELMFDPDAAPDPWEWDEDEEADEDSEEEDGEELEQDEEAGEGADELAAAYRELIDIEVEIAPEISTRLTSSGMEMLFVGRVLDRWLRESPAGPLRLGEEEAGLALAALVVGWSSTIVHALSGAALTFEELVEATGAANQGALATRLEALEDSCLVELLEGPGGEVRYAATPWLRQAIAPLGAAARHERRRRKEDSAPPDVLDVGAAFLLTLPMVELPADLSGLCRMSVRIPIEGPATADEEPETAGATARVESGHVVSVDLELDSSSRTWAGGAPIDWLEAVVTGADTVKLGGDTHLAGALVASLHEALFTSWA